MEPTVGNLAGGVRVEAVQGTLETQRVDAVVVPMIYDEILFTCAGQTLLDVVGSVLIDRFEEEKGGCEVVFGDFVMVENLPGLQCQAVIFLSLIPWNNDPEGVAIDVLRSGIKRVLTSCDSMGFGSVAFPVLGVGNALCFPDVFMTDLLREGICAFERARTGRTPLAVHIVNYPSKNETSEGKFLWFEEGDMKPSSTFEVEAEDSDEEAAWGSCRKGNPTPTDTVANDAPKGATGGSPPGRKGVHVQVVNGRIESQQVDALVLPMIDDDPLFICAGQTLDKVMRSELIERFKKENGGREVELGHLVVMENVPGLQSKAVIFLSLIPWSDDPEGVAVEVLRLGINEVLSSCDSRGFGSVAFPALGVGDALRFPDGFMTQVIRKEICAFEQDRVSSRPLDIRILNPPHRKEVFKSSQEALKHRVTQQQDKNPGSAPKRIILLGKTGVGKSSLGNTLFGEELFQPDHSASSGTKECRSVTRSVNGRPLTLIDTPGLFDTDLSDDELRPRIMNCITECAPGPHAFLILLRVDKYTKQEQEIITQICRNFSEDALKFSVVVFTHGNQLREGVTIKSFVDQKKDLSELVKKCGGRCHVFDNDHWNSDQPNNYRSNAFQRERLLETIDQLVRGKKGCHYTNDVLYHVGQHVHREEVRISRLRAATQPMRPEQITQKAKSIVSQRFLTKLAAATTGALLGALFGVGSMVKLVLSMLERPVVIAAMGPISGFLSIPAATVRQAALTAAAVGGGLAGGIIGARTALNATEQAESPSEAMRLAFRSLMELRETVTHPLSLGPP